MQIEPTAIALTRLANQYVSTKGPSHPADVVRHMGAMQAQNYSMSKWAIGVRMLAATDAQIENALDDGQPQRIAFGNCRLEFWPCFKIPAGRQG